MDEIFNYGIKQAEFLLITYIQRVFLFGVDLPTFASHKKATVIEWCSAFGRLLRLFGP